MLSVCLSKVSHLRCILVKHAQDSCACTTLLCMHNTRVHALEGPGTKAATQNKKRRGSNPGAALFCWVPALGPGPSSACTRVLCMHKSVVHAQESCACTRIKTCHDVPDVLQCTKTSQTYQDVPRKSWKACQTNQDSGACTRFLCMQNTLAHARHSCACTDGARAQGPDPKRALGVRPGPALFFGPGLGPWPLQCMRKSVVHAQECCARTRILCMHKSLGLKTQPCC